MKALSLMIACFIAVCFCLTGCGKDSEEKAVEKMIAQNTGGKATVDLDKGKMRVKTRDGGEMVINADGAVKLPADFPRDVFVIKNAEVKMTMDMPQGKTVSLVTGEDLTAVYDKYQQEMKSKGWTEQMAMNMGEGASLVYEKGDRMTHITISRDDEQTVINLVLAKK